MAPSTRARSLPPSIFPTTFSKQKTSTYTDIPPRSSAHASASTASLHSPSHYVRTLSWNCSGSFIATGAHDRTLRVWNPERVNVRNSTELQGTTKAHRGYGSSGGHGGPGGGGGGNGGAGAVEKVQFHPFNENELASCHADGSVRLWDVRSKASVGEVRIGGGGQGTGPFGLAWAPDGGEVLVGTKDNILIRIDRATLKPLSSHPQPVQTNTCAFNWSGTHLYATNGDGCVKLLRYPSLEPEYTLNAHTSACYTLALSPSGDYLAVGGGDALVSLWDTESWICVRTLELVDGPVKSVDFSFDGSYIVAGAEDASEGGGGGGGGMGIGMGMGGGKGAKASLRIAHVESGDVVHTVELSQAASQVSWHPSRYALAYSADREGLKIVGGLS